MVCPVEHLSGQRRSSRHRVYPPFSKTFQPCGHMQTAISPDATAPGQTRLSARRKDLQKNTQRLTGVRMRHRGTVVQRNRNEWSMEGPHPGVRTSTPTAIHAHCLLLFCSFFGPEMPDLSSVLSCRPCCFHLLFALRPTSSPVFSRNSKKTASSARQDGICN